MHNETDVLIAGGGLGGVAAALAALRRGRSVVLVEETDWIGGQLTSQGVPPDEHTWIEQFGCTRTYRQLRNAIRDHYRTWYPLTEEARARPDLNPGEGRVSRLCHEPRVAAAVLDAMVAPYVAADRLKVYLGHKVIAADIDGDRVTGLTIENIGGGRRKHIAAKYVLDATELGDLLPLTGAEHVTGFESGKDTGEPSAPAEAQPGNMQAFSWVFALDHQAGVDNTIERPAGYSDWVRYQPPKWPNPLLSLSAPHPRTLENVERRFVPNPAPERVVADQRLEGGDMELWTFRRILSRAVLRPGFADSDVTVVNWPMIDYLPGPLIGVSDEERDKHLAGARELSLSMLYWLQTEAPRQDGGTGWPGLRLRGDVFGTTDGFAKAPYVRESRRIEARYRIVEQDLSMAVRGSHGAVAYPDSVGVGMYRIDLHPSTGGDTYIDVPSCPFQLPLGALIPVRLRNLLPAAKNIGTTHITNGCYRLHPVEWNIGEVVGALAAHCLANGLEPSQVHADPARLRVFQDELAADGVELAWPKIAGY